MISPFDVDVVLKCLDDLLADPRFTSDLDDLLAYPRFSYPRFTSDLDDLLAYPRFTSDMKDQYFQLYHELIYMRIYMSCLAEWNDSPFGKDKNFGFVYKSHIESALDEAGRIYREWKFDIFFEKFRSLDTVTSELLETIQHCKPKIKEDCLNFLDCPFPCWFSSDELPDFMMRISATLPYLLKEDMMLDVKGKIETFEDNLNLFKELFEFTAKRCGSPEDLKYFKIHIQAWACRAACLLLLYWVLDVKKQNMARKMDVILSHLQKKISPSSPAATRMYLAVLKASKPSAEESLTVGKLVWKFVLFLKNNLQIDPEKDDIQMLFIDLIFLITFLMDRPEAEKFAEGKLILTEADAVVNEVASLISSLSSSKIKEGIAEERNSLLHTFLGKASAIKAEVRKFYVHLFLDSSSFNYPKIINVLGFIDSLLENLEGFTFHFPKYQIMMLQKELLSLKESNLKYCYIMQNKHKDINDLWTQIVNMAYNAERVVNSFIYMKISLWHDILCLSDVIEEVKHIKSELESIQDRHTNDIHALNYEMSPHPLLPLHANNIPIVDMELVVGFKQEVEEIRSQLMSGSAKLDIISIVGMPGLGKTTLAKRVYSDASIQRHFNKSAWCTVSQTFNSKRMLLDILRDVDDCDGNLSNMEEEDLADKVRKCLKGQRYLIVMDDIWDISAWDVLKMSFPEDNNGSRIMFTSRIHNIMPEPKSGSTHFPLNPLSKEESWELLRKKLFGQESCPLDFVDIGRQIATDCKGLPLSIVLTAGLLKENVDSLVWWKHVRESLHSLIAKEGCRDVVELSYQHLPEFLRPCFLYFGLFREDQAIRVKELTLLWISEGFIQEHEIKSLEAVAEEYLMDLVARSLVFVTKRSSTGGIKACSVHDLLHDFCIAKGEEEKVCKVIRENEDWYIAGTYARYRVSIQSPECWNSFPEHVPLASGVHSVLSLCHGKPENIKYLSFAYFKFIRVLVLYWERRLPEGITEMVLLRYLTLNSSYIPPSIWRLENLETLCLDVLMEKLELPLNPWKMKKLRHLYVTDLRVPDGFCGNIPPLVNVQTLSSLYLPCAEKSEMFLRMIPNVRKLRCSFEFPDGMVSNRTVKLDFLSRLESLSIALASRRSNLCSYAFYFPLTLKKLSLTDFILSWSGISPIAQLPNLEVLKLYGSFCGKAWNVEDGEFLKLKYLVLSGLDVEQLNASDDSFPCLERLRVAGCVYLVEISSRFGRILTLKTIRVTQCISTLLGPLEEIKEEQVDLGNEHFEVLISRVFDENSAIRYAFS